MAGAQKMKIGLHSQTALPKAGCLTFIVCRNQVLGIFKVNDLKSLLSLPGVRQCAKCQSSRVDKDKQKVSGSFCSAAGEGTGLAASE